MVTAVTPTSAERVQAKAFSNVYSFCCRYTRVIGDDMRLPGSVQEIADVIGRERALYLVGRLPRCYMPKGGHVILYVPKRMSADHELVKILGWSDAEKLRQAFGGEILHPATCADVYRPFRDAAIIRLVAEGVPTEIISEWFGLGARTVKNVAAGFAALEIPQEGFCAANDNTASTTKRRAV